MGKLINVLLFISLASKAFAQAPVDSISYQSSVDNALKTYYHSLGSGSGIYNGMVFTGYSPATEGFPFYQSEDWQKGTIFYDEVPYKDVLVKYDLVADEVLVKTSEGFAIRLYSPRVKYFFFLGHHFIYVAGNNKSPLRPGFYDLLRSGNMTILAKRSKRMIEKMTTTATENKYFQSDEFFIEKGGIYYPVKNLKSALDVTGDKKKDIRRFLRKNRIRFRRDKESALIKIAEYYNQ